MNCCRRLRILFVRHKERKGDFRMRMTKKRALIGYEPKGVESLVASMQGAFKLERNRLVSELEALDREREQLAEHVGNLAKIVSKHAAFERELSDQLIRSHLEYAKKVFTAASAEVKISSGEPENPPSSNDLDPEQKQAN